ncbi:MAG: peroxisomal assembly protein [Candelina submexicana]|nr:MAG: peroxisomal assembly protein [Candelina submexicana]
MADQGSIIQHRKWRRRRGQDRPPISARLLLDEGLKGDVGIVSEDLFAELFPRHVFIEEQNDSHGATPTAEEIRHIAISPWTTVVSDLEEDLSWTIIPIRAQPEDQLRSKPLAYSTVQVPASSTAIQAFEYALQEITPTKAQYSRVPIEIRLLDVVPLGLSTVFVTVDGYRLKKLEESHEKFGGGFGGHQAKRFPSKGKVKVSPVDGTRIPLSIRTPELRKGHLKDTVRKALEAVKVVYSGVLIPLPLPAHPITHDPPPPAQITACEPVSQGLLLPSTKIIIAKTHSAVHFSRHIPQTATHRPISGLAEEDDATSNEQFFSAAEDGIKGLSPSPAADRGIGNSNGLGTESDTSGAENGDLSDDFLQDIITLNTPELPFQASGVLSSQQAATPRAKGAHSVGIGTPGSVLSNYTAIRASSNGYKGKIFKVHGLLRKVPNDTLHPTPTSQDDEEARIFVNVGALVRIGCFSGDWVKVEPSLQPHSNSFGLWDLSPIETGPEDWRAMKIFGLPDTQVRSPRYRVSKLEERRLSNSHASQIMTPKAFLSPVLLANLNSPSHVRISPLFSTAATKTIPTAKATEPRYTSSSNPPLAKEVKLVKIYTPLSGERALDATIMRGLKQYFEHKRRLVKVGDLIGIGIDEILGKTSFGVSGSRECEDFGDELISLSEVASAQPTFKGNKVKKNNVVWYKIGHVVVQQSDHLVDEEQSEVWGGLTAIDLANIKMAQAGSEQSRLPGAMANPWEYYLGVLQAPRLDAFNGTLGSLTTGAPRLYTTRIRRQLREMISSAMSPRAIHLGLPPIAVLLISTQRNIGKTTVATQACTDLGIHTFIIDAYDILTEDASGGDIKTEAFLRTRAERALACGASSTALLIRHIDGLTADRITSVIGEVLADSRVLIATTTDLDKVPDGLRALFTHELEMSAPDEGEREGILRALIESKAVRTAPFVDLAAVAVKTAALVAGDLVDVVERAMVAQRERMVKLAQDATRFMENGWKVTVRDVQVSGGEFGRCVTKSDFDIAVDAARKNFADAIGAPKIPNVSWDDVGGLSNVKDAVMETIQLPLERPELFAKGMKKRSGILFYGPPGTGKTLLAKAIATEFSLNFFSVKGPELLNMYIGESEANVRRVFQRARDARPCVVFFDELDSVAPKRGNQGDSGGVMDRIVSQLLAELDGMSGGDEGGGGVFVIGATNRPDLLDQALLRPGRFDKMLYLGVSDTHEKQLTILKALTRKFTLHPDMSLNRVAGRLPFTYTGADLYALCSDAMLKAITRQASTVDEKIKALPGGPVTTAYFFDHLATKEDSEVTVTEGDFYAAQRELVGSVSARELKHYERVRRTFEEPGASLQDGNIAITHSTGSLQQELSTKERATSPPRAKMRQPITPIRSSPHTGFNLNSKSPTPSAEDADSEYYYDLPDTVDDEHTTHDFSDLEDEYIVRTAHLSFDRNKLMKPASINGTVNGSGVSGKGKSTVKGYRALHGFDDPAKDDDEELYT